jgi:23S rRNA pseudouridine2605 synthase
MERLQKLLATAGHGSRREIEQWIRERRLSVDGQTAQLGDRARPGADIRLDGQPLNTRATGERAVLIYHKPTGEVTTRRDPAGRPTVFERLPPPPSGRWVVIGRLDVNTTGLLLFTTDGALAHRLMHPSAEIQREYLVRVHGQPGPEVLERLRSGVVLEDGPARFERIVAGGRSDSHSWYKVTLREGRNREVRRLWQAVGLDVSRLMRLRYGSVELPDDLPPGSWRLMQPQQARML